MGGVTQVAFQIDDEILASVDAVATRDSLPRAEVLRIAVRQYLARRREEQIEARLAAGYADQPPGRDEQGLADASLDGLRAADLDW